MVFVVWQGERDLIIGIFRHHGGSFEKRPRNVTPDLIAIEALAESTGVLLRAGAALPLDSQATTGSDMPRNDVDAALIGRARAYHPETERGQMRRYSVDDIILREHGMISLPAYGSCCDGAT
jgi:hypothetical protein